MEVLTSIYSGWYIGDYMQRYIKSICQNFTSTIKAFSNNEKENINSLISSD